MRAVIARRYELRRLLGRGGMAEVWEAVDLRLDRPVAVKLFAGVDEALRARFLQEARVAAQFAHPNAATVYDTGEDDGALYLVMELVEGPTLARVLAAHGRLEPAAAVDVADQVLAALGAGHRAGLVHRDVKPSNILFGRGPDGRPDGIAKLVDFGIAKGVGEMATHLTAAGQVVGTPRYLSPEQAAGREATPASDLYAVGVVLYEMLCGAPPFAGETPVATAAAHQRAPVPPLAQRRPGLDPGLVAVVERALAKAPAARFADADAMRRALAARWSGAGVAVPPEAGGDPTAIAGTPTIAAAGAGGSPVAASVGSVPGDPRAGFGAADDPTLADADADADAVADAAPDETGVAGTAARYAAASRRPVGSTPGAGRRGSVAVLATLAVLLVGAVAAAALLMTGGGGDDPPPQAAAPDAPGSTTTTAPSTSSTTTTTTAPEETTTTAPPPSTAAPDTPPPSIEGLAALLIQDPDAHGKKGADLLDKIIDLQEETGEKRAEEAGKRLDDVSKWAEKGELDPETAQFATAVLRALAES